MKSFPLQFNFSYLLTEWKSFFKKQGLFADLTAGATVAFIAIPLSLAIALASGVPPATGLITAIIAGIVCAIFGGTPLAVSGPAAAMSVIVASNVEQFGLEGLALICLLAGCMQLISGLLGLGKFCRYVPLPVISGFTAGIGVIIMINQLPRVFGLLPPAESHTFSVFAHLFEYFHQINLVCFALVAGTFALIFLLQRFAPKIPAILTAVVASSLVAYLLHLKVPLIGEIPRTLPVPHLPLLTKSAISEIFLNAFAVFLLASLETLLSSSAVDKLAGGKKHDSNQELIGQGLGNISVSFFAGMPVTGVIARSAINVRAGAKTRRASIFHALILLCAVFFIAPIISLIPIAALAGVLFAVALSMISYKEFHGLWVTSRMEGVIYGVTFLTIIFMDLMAGIQAGIIAASLIALFKATKTNLHVSTSSEDNLLRISLSGSLTFLSVSEFVELEKHLEKTVTDNSAIILDLSGINNLDSSGAAAIVDLFNHCNAHQIAFYLKGLARRFESLFKISGGETILDKHYIINESELKNKENVLTEKSFHGRLIHGVRKFYSERQVNDRRLYDYLAAHQDPHTLFITCSDSRINPSEMTSTDPGELFIVRNVGNFIPPYLPDSCHSEAAALEFALGKLNITDVVVCGHANCGAMQACAHKGPLHLAKELQSWIDQIKAQLILGEDDVNSVAKQNVLNQMQNLKSYPIVQKKLAEQTLTLHAWFYEFNQNLIYEWSNEALKFEPLFEQEKIEVPT